MRTSIIIPNFNGEELLKKNIPVVLRVKGVQEVIVVDDGSTDGSLEMIRNNYPKIKIIENKKNLGFPLTVNRGVKEAAGEIAVLLNTDVTPEEKILDALLPHFEDPQVFAVGCLDKSIEDGKTILRGRGVGKWQRGFLIHARGKVDKTSTLWVSGGSGAFRKKIWDELGGMDELYNPFYWEDIDLSWRAQKAGYKVLFEPKSVVIHRHEEGIIKQKYVAGQIKTIAYRNQFIFVWKNIDDPEYLLNHIFWLPYYFLKSLANLDLAFLKGFLSALLRLPRILKSRSKVKEFSIKEDREILASFSDLG